MSEYMFLYRRTSEAYQEAMGSPEKAQQTMKKWKAWMDGLAAKGHLKSLGQPLDRSGRLVGGKKKTVTDGPYAETKDVVGGYSIIEAGNLDEAAGLASGCPILEGGGSVEIRPVLQLTL